MKLVITSIADSAVGRSINRVTTAFEDQLCPLINGRNYGGNIEHFAIIIVSVYSDPLQNQIICKANNRLSRYKDRSTGKTVRVLNMAVPIDPEIVLTTSQLALPSTIKELVLGELSAPAYEMPKQFDRIRLLADFQSVLLEAHGNLAVGLPVK